MDAFARGPQRDPLRPSCIASLRSNRLARMSIDKNAGWRPWLSYGTGKTFWHNEATGETSWERPKGAPERVLQLRPLNAGPTTSDALQAQVDSVSCERAESEVSHRSSDRAGALRQPPGEDAASAGAGLAISVQPRSCYRRQTFNRLRELAELAPAERPPPQQLSRIGSATAREAPQQQSVDSLHDSGAHTHRDRRALRSYLDSMVAREADKWGKLHYSNRVTAARTSEEEYASRLDDIHERVHEGFKQMLVAGAHCMDLVLSVNDYSQESITTEAFVHLAAKLGVRVERFEAESLFEVYGEQSGSMTLERFGEVFINTDAIHEKMMAPALGKLEGTDGVRKVVEQELQDNERLQKRLSMRDVCRELGISNASAVEMQAKMEKKSRKAQIQQVKQIDNEVKRSARLAEFMHAHAERFGGAGNANLLWKHLDGIRTEEERGKVGKDNKKLLALVKGMFKEWQKLVGGQPIKAQMAYDNIDKATKRMDQRAILQILSRKPKYLTTSWVATHKAGLLALGATSQVGDNYATEVGRKMLLSDEMPLREGACKLLGMILDPKDKEILAQIHKRTSRREGLAVRKAAKSAMQDIMWRARDAPKK